MSSKQRRPRIKKFNGPVGPLDNGRTANSPEERNDEENEQSMEDKFERELHWCIEQLQLGLESERSDSKQAIEALKIKKILQSGKTPLIKKRQVMRNTFGDYRQKMKTQEKKSAARMRKLEVTSGESSTTIAKSVFYRKRSYAETTLETIPPSENHTSHKTEGQNGEEISKDRDTFDFKFQETESQFKFNFNISSGDSANVSGSQDAEVECSSSLCETGRDNVTKDTDSSHMGPIVATTFVTDRIHDHFVAQKKSGSDFKFNFSVT